MKSLSFLNITKPNVISLENKRIVISFSLYGNAERYIRGLYENCKDINRIYPKYWIYVFLGSDFDHSILNVLNEIKNLKLIHTGLVGHINMSYRFFSIDYPEVGIAFSRDCDCRIINRDQYCINTFINSIKKFQIIRDNESHCTPILGGMWGIKKGLLNTSIYYLFEKYVKEKNTPFGYGDDQTFLAKYIYPNVKYDALIFDGRFHFYKDEVVVKIEVPDEITEFGGLECVGRPM
jgi:hypothetical protein